MNHNTDLPDGFTRFSNDEIKTIMREEEYNRKSLREGFTRKDAERVYNRLRVDKAAHQTRYRDGHTIAETIENYLIRGYTIITETEHFGRIKMETQNGNEILLKDKTACDYLRLLMNTLEV